MRYAFVAMILGLVLPVCVVSVLADLDKRRLLGLVAVVAIGSMALFLVPDTYYSSSRDWLAAEGHLPFLAVSALLAIVLLAAAGPVLHRRSASSLDWPRSMSQGEMQKRGVAYLVRRGWQVEPLDSFSAISIYRCRKNALRMFCLFLKDPVPFERLLRNVSRTPGIVITSVVVVNYDRPAPGLLDASRKASISTIFYKDLGNVDTICMTGEEERLASRSRNPPITTTGPQMRSISDPG